MRRERALEHSGKEGATTASMAEGGSRQCGRKGGGDRQTGALFWFSEGCGVSAQEAQVADGVELQ